jgi:hypothetical protein
MIYPANTTDLFITITNEMMDFKFLDSHEKNMLYSLAGYTLKILKKDRLSL